MLAHRTKPARGYRFDQVFDYPAGVGVNRQYGSEVERRADRAETPQQARHVWVRQSRATHLPPLPGLLLEWRQVGGRWEGLVFAAFPGSPSSASL